MTAGDRNPRKDVHFRPAAQSRRPPDSGTIAVLVSKPGNFRVLQQNLNSHRVVACESAEILKHESVDVVIIDPSSLAANRQALRTWRASLRPVLVPVLLAAPARDLNRIGDMRDLADDVLPTPIRKTELRTRINTLLRLRRMSETQASLRHAAQEALTGVSRAFRALSACNEAVLWGRDEDTLLRNVCKLMVEEGDYLLSFVGYTVDDAERSIRIMAGTERALAFAGHLRISWGDDELGQGSVGTCIRTGRPVAISDTGHDPGFAPWRAAAANHAVASIISLPIRVNGVVIGALVIGSERLNAFDDEEVQLLDRMAENLAFGIQTLREERERIQQERKATFLAYSDPLTGLANRTRLSQALAALQGRGKRGAAVLFLDLDGFKVVNDALGHATGDRLLQEVAARIRGTVRDNDLVARQGGDEFIILLDDRARHDDADPADHGINALAATAAEVAERILHTLSEPFQLGNSKHTVTASLGISLYPKDGNDGESLLTHADQAMYLAKASGGNTARFYSEELSVRQTRQLNIQRRLREAVDTGDFELYYQPIVEMASNRIACLEALIRWPQPDGTFIPPSEFIPIAEESGLILPLGRWILQQAVEHLASLRTAAPDLSVSVNLSARQLGDPHLAEYLAECVARAGVEPRSVILEVTETSVMAGPIAMKPTLHALHEAGHALALDDFGTGYSSLWRLRELPLALLKIDKSFLDGIPADPGALAIIRTILELARQLNLEVIGEGVETPEQWEVLRDLDCHLAQGFLMCRPQPLKQIAQTLSTRTGKAS